MLSKLYKLIFDLGICYLLGAFLLNFFGGEALHTGGFVCLLITGVISILLRDRRLSILAAGSIPFVGILILRPEWAEIIVYALTWGYMVFLLITDRLVTSRGEFLDRVKRILYLAILLPIFLLTELQAFQRAISATIPYLTTAIVCFCFMLRHLRTDHGMDSQKGYYRQQVWEMVLFLAVCMLLTLVRAPQNLMKGLSLLFLNVIRPAIAFIVGLISMIFGGVIYLIISLLSFVTKSRELEVRKAEMGDNILVSLDLTVDTVLSKEWILPLLYSLGVILGLVVLFFFFRWLMGEKYKQRLPQGVSEIREELRDSSDRGGRLKRKYSAEPRERVRYYYYKYLLHLRSKKVLILSGDTTREVEQKYYERLSKPSKEQTESSEQMKELYRKARYQNQTEITTEEAERVKKIYDTIKIKKV